MDKTTLADWQDKAATLAIEGAHSSTARIATRTAARPSIA